MLARIIDGHLGLATTSGPVTPRRFGGGHLATSIDHSNLTTLVAAFGAEIQVDLGLDPIGALTDRMLEL